MSIEVSQAGVADDREIEQFLENHPGALPYHHIYWLDAIKRAYGHDFIYLVARTSGQLVGVLPICVFTGFMGTRSFCSLPFCDIGGCVAENDQVREILIASAVLRMEAENCELLEIRQRFDPREMPGDLAERKVSMLLDLPDNAESLKRGFRSKLRSQIRKAEKNGLDFEEPEGAPDVVKFFDVFRQNMHRLGSPVHSIEWFRALQENYRERLVVGKIRYRNRIVGAGLMILNNQYAAIPWASTLQEYNRLAPNMLLYWNMLRIACEQGCRVFDFGRSIHGGSTYRFKRQWGAYPVPLDWHSLDRSGSRVSVVTTSKFKGREFLALIWRMSPSVLADNLGPRLRKHISL